MTEGNRENLSNEGRGRPKGSKNKLPMKVARMVDTAMKLAGKHLREEEMRAIRKLEKQRDAGDPDVEVPDPILQEVTAGEAYLMTQAIKEPRAFLALVAKLMPTKIDAEVTVFSGDEMVAMLQKGRARIQQREGTIDGDRPVH